MGWWANDDVDRHEEALRRLPEAHSLALRLKSAGVADDVVCGYLHIEPEGLETLLRVAREKLDAELRERLITRQTVKKFN